MSGHYNTELFTEIAQKIIAGHNSSIPLFLYIAHHAVHSGNVKDPLQAPKRLVDVCRNKSVAISLEQNKFYNICS